jgi:hypothetical protein
MGGFTTDMAGKAIDFTPIDGIVKKWNFVCFSAFCHVYVIILPQTYLFNLPIFPTTLTGSFFNEASTHFSLFFKIGCMNIAKIHLTFRTLTRLMSYLTKPLQISTFTISMLRVVTFVKRFKPGNNRQPNNPCNHINTFVLRFPAHAK